MATPLLRSPLIAVDTKPRNITTDILAEAALLNCAILLTGDAHLRGLDFQRASLELRALDVEMPVVATPREIWRSSAGLLAEPPIPVQLETDCAQKRTQEIHESIFI